MKISFSTLGCPEWSWQEIIIAAKDLGYDGIEVRGIENQLYVPKAKPFLPNKLEDTKKRLEELGLSISCITSSCYLHMKEQRERYIQEAKEYINTAAALCTPYIRVLGDKDPQPGQNVDVKSVVEALAEVGEHAAMKGVTVLIETNGVFADSNILKGVMTEINNSSVGVLWDIHHPYRFMGESVNQTYQALKPYIKHIHIKDSILQQGKVRYKMMGQGDVPIVECLTLLKQDDYQGFISLEWVKRWYADLEDPGIVFVQFKHHMCDLWEKI